MNKFNKILNNGKQRKVRMSLFFFIAVFKSIQTDDINRTGSPTNIYYREIDLTLDMRLETLMVASEMNMKERLDKAVIESGKIGQVQLLAEESTINVSSGGLGDVKRIKKLNISSYRNLTIWVIQQQTTENVT